jgi:hypothetical protein
VPGYYSDPAMLGYNYTVTEFTTKYLKLQLNFENPFEISREPVDPELLLITINDVEFFFTPFGKTIDPLKN